MIVALKSHQAWEVADQMAPLLTSVQEIGRLVDVRTPYMDAVLALVQQMGRVAGVYPTFPDPEPGSEDEAVGGVD